MDDVRPNITIGRSGYLAVSDSRSGFRIGVTARTEDEVRRLFDEEVAAWRELRARREREQ